MGKLLAIALVLAAAGPARAEDAPPAPAGAGAPGAKRSTPAVKKKARVKKQGKDAASAKEEKGARGATPTGGQPKEPPCEPVKPCPID